MGERGPKLETIPFQFIRLSVREDHFQAETVGGF
jgi:hypothetical protein